MGVALGLLGWVLIPIISSLYYLMGRKAGKRDAFGGYLVHPVDQCAACGASHTGVAMVEHFLEFHA